MCVGCGWSGSPPSAGGERYVSMLLEAAVEWTRLGVEALMLELFVKNLEPLINRNRNRSLTKGCAKGHHFPSGVQQSCGVGLYSRKKTIY